MKENEQASLSIKKIALITLLLVFILGIGVKATTQNIRTVKIVLADNYQIEVITTKKVVSDILNENHIVVLPNESIIPALDAEIGDTNPRITISSTADSAEIVNLAEESEDITLEQLLSNYSTITEKIVTETIDIPYQTVNKSGNVVDKNNSAQTYRVDRNGRNGQKEITYKIKYKNDIEIERNVLSEVVKKEAVNEIVSIATGANRSGSTSRNSLVPTNKNVAETLSSLVEGITPEVKTLNTSAYTDSTCDKDPSSPTYGITASGARTSAWYTVAAGKGYPIGTIIYIPYFANKPNGGWFIVQDRGGAISNNRLDVYMTTYGECVQFGRKNLECYIYVR